MCEGKKHAEMIFYKIQQILFHILPMYRFLNEEEVDIVFLCFMLLKVIYSFITEGYSILI